MQKSMQSAQQKLTYILYKEIDLLGKGAYGYVYSVETPLGKMALKKMKASDEEFSISSATLREIALIRALSPHPNIISIENVNVTPDSVNMFMPLAKGTLRSFIPLDGPSPPNNPLDDKRSFKVMVYQLIKTVAYITSMNVMHRDIKPDNVLFIDSNTEPPQLMLADFGLSRANVCFVTGLTCEVFTRWYKAPEILLGGKYKEKADVWAVACVVAEMFQRMPLFPGDSEIDTLFKIFEILGTPTEETWPEVVEYPYWKKSFPKFKKALEIDDFQDIDKDFFDLLKISLVQNPNKRATIFELQSHRYFDDIRKFVDEESSYAFPPAVELSARKKAERMDHGYPKVKFVPDVTPVRHILFDALVLLSHKFRHSKQTLFLSTQLFDVFAELSPNSLTLKKVFLYGLACTKIAGDFHEIYPVPFDDYIMASDHSYRKEELMEAMIEVLTVLNFDIYRSTALDFLIDTSSNFFDSDIRKTAQAILVAALATDVWFERSAEEIAFSCILLVCLHFQTPFKYKITENIYSCAKSIAQTILDLDPDDSFLKIKKGSKIPSCRTVADNALKAFPTTYE